MCLSVKTLDVFLQSAHELSMTDGRHAFFLVHTHYELDPDEVKNLIGQDNETSAILSSAMEAVFLLVSRASTENQLPDTTGAPPPVDFNSTDPVRVRQVLTNNFP